MAANYPQGQDMGDLGWNYVPSQSYVPHAPYWDASYHTRMGLAPWMYDDTSTTGGTFTIDCSSENNTSARVSVSTQVTLRYSVKVMNPHRKTSFVVQKLKITKQFASIDEMKQDLSEILDAEIEQIGFVSPGHGAKGKHNSLMSNDDLDDMYEEHRGKREILLWCYAHIEANSGGIPEKQASKKRLAEDGPGTSQAAPSSKRQACQQKIQEVEEIVGKLKEKHGSCYSVEKLNAWAHMIHLGKHGSYETPPDLPYFGRRSQSSAGSSSTTSNTTSTESQSPRSDSSALSPSKRIQLRSQCIDQLDRWHSLLEKGGITTLQYENLKTKIMGDILEDYNQ